MRVAVINLFTQKNNNRRMSFLFQKYCDTSKANDLDREKKFLETFLRPVEPHAYSPRINYDAVNSDPLDTILENAHEEFVRNGIEVELDAVDVYQFRMRRGNQASTPPDISPSTSPESTQLPSTSPTEKTWDTSSVEDYLEMRRQRVTERRKKQTKTSWCVFCKNNGEQPEWYSSHTLKDNMGRTSCPILRRYVCPKCGKSGDTAHTIRYCPKNEGELEPAISQLLKTERLASGRLRATKF